MSSNKNNILGTALGLGAAASLFCYYSYNNKKTSCESKCESPSSNGNHFLLAGDIGGTNSRMALFTTSSREPFHVKYYSNEEKLHSGETFENAIVIPFLKSCFEKDYLQDIDPKTVKITACLAVAGPVRNNAVHMTNIGHVVVVVDGNAMEKSDEPYLQMLERVKIVNDFVGMGYGALDLNLDKETVELMPDSKAKIDPLGPKVCVGAGTGLGECYMTVSTLNAEQGYECYPSEGGHVEFSPRTDVEVELLSALRKKFSERHRVSVERVVSGKGLANVYEFLAERFPERIEKDVHAEFMKAGDMKGKVVSVNSKPGNLCYDAMVIFASAYGSEVGSAALKFIPTGGLYVVGGLTPKNLKYIQGQDSPFMKAFKDKGRVSGLLDTIPLFAVLNEDLGLRGARVCALREFQHAQRSS